MLKEANQVINPKLLELADGRGGGGGYGRHRGKLFHFYFTQTPGCLSKVTKFWYFQAAEIIGGAWRAAGVKENAVFQGVEVAAIVESEMEEEIVEVTAGVILAVAALLIEQASRQTVLVVKALQLKIHLLFPLGR